MAAKSVSTANNKLCQTQKNIKDTFVCQEIYEITLTNYGSSSVLARSKTDAISSQTYRKILDILVAETAFHCVQTNLMVCQLRWKPRLLICTQSSTVTTKTTYHYFNNFLRLYYAVIFVFSTLHVAYSATTVLLSHFAKQPCLYKKTIECICSFACWNLDHKWVSSFLAAHQHIICYSVPWKMDNKRVSTWVKTKSNDH